MGVKTHSLTEDNNKYQINRKAGRNIIKRRPIFSPDGESLALIVENVVRVYNIQTGDCARTLETESDIKELINIQFLENDDYNLYGCSSNGCVTTWTWQNGAVLREINLKINQKTRVLSFVLIDSQECILICLENLKVMVTSFNIKTGDLVHEYKGTKLKYVKMLQTTLGWCNGERFIAISNGSNNIFIQNINKPHIYSKIKNIGSFRVLSVCAHHADSAIATVDTLGRVIITKGNLFEHKNLAKEVLHWHHLPTFDVQFSAQGNYLYSGGMERVLVKWSLGHLAKKANEKMFITRLPGIIRYITTYNTLVALTLTNNSIVIANPQMRVLATILECGGLSPVVRTVGTALIYHRQLEALLMGGRTGHLQFYSTATDKVLYNIDITGINTLPPQRDNLIPIETEVTCAAISGDGRWLVTSEYRNDGITYPEERLKFWNMDLQNATPYNLNTCVSLSHGGCNVVSLALNQGGEFCLSAGTDQKFRVWKKEGKKKVSWSCLTACYYSSGIAHVMSHGVLNNYKVREPFTPGECKEFPYQKDCLNNDIVQRVFNIHEENTKDKIVVNPGLSENDEAHMGGVAISTDGSLIAAWFGHKLTLWDTYECNLRTSLSHPSLRPKGIHVVFGNEDSAHYLVCTTESCLAVWSLLSLTVKWLVQIQPTCLVSDPFSNKIATVTTKNDVFIFSPHDSTPVLTKKRIADPVKGVFINCVFGNSSKNQTRLYMMKNDSEVYCLEPLESDTSRLEAVSQAAAASRFSALLAEQLAGARPAAPAVSAPTASPAATANAVAQMLSGAPHMIPPVSLLSTAFLQQISGHKLDDETKESDEVSVIQDIFSDDDEVEPQKNGSAAPRIVELWAPNYDSVKEKRLKKIVADNVLQLDTVRDVFSV